MLGLGIVSARRRRAAMLNRFLGEAVDQRVELGRLSTRAKWEIGWLFLLVTSLCVALARPLYFHFDERSETQGAPYLIALDVSRSMLATDLKPTRYAAATNALSAFFSESRGDRVGLITFAGIGYLNAPLTFDMRALRTILSYVNPGGLTDPGSSMASAMDRAARYFTSNAIPQRTLILISDGEELDDGRALRLARVLHRDHRMTLHTIGVGTVAGAKIPAFRPQTPVTMMGNRFNGGLNVGSPQPTNDPSATLTTRLDENNLRRIANAGGGRYYRLGQDGEGLKQLRQEVLRPLAETMARNDLRNYREGFFVPLAIALIACVLRLVWGVDRFARNRPLTRILETQS